MMMMMMSVPVVVDDSLSIRAIDVVPVGSYSTPGRPVALLEGRGKRGMNDDLGGYERLRWMERSTKSGGPGSRSRA